MKTIDAITHLENFLASVPGRPAVTNEALKCLKGVVIINTMPLSPAAQRIVNAVQSFDSLRHCILPVSAPTVDRLVHSMVSAAFQVQSLNEWDEALHEALRPMGNLVLDEPDGAASLQQMIERTVAIALEGRRFRDGVMSMIGEPK